MRTFGENIRRRERALAEAYYEDEGGRGVHGHEYDQLCRAWQREIVPSSSRERLGVYPGSFNPPTIAHLEIARAAQVAHSLVRVDLAISAVPFGKDAVARPSFDERIAVVRDSVSAIVGLEVVITDAQYIADIAQGYDIVVMGADKWVQVNDPAWYDNDPVARDRAVDRLPGLALTPRPPHSIPAEHRLDVADDLLEISSSAARAGRTEWMTPAALAFHARTGAWAPEEV